MNRADLSGNGLAAIAFSLIAMVVLTLITSIYFYNVNRIGKGELVLELVEKYDINPMIIKCMHGTWETVPTFQICSILAKNAKISEAELRKALNN